MLTDVASSKLLNIFTQSIAQYDNALGMLLILGGGRVLKCYGSIISPYLHNHILSDTFRELQEPCINLIP